MKSLFYTKTNEVIRYVFTFKTIKINNYAVTKYTVLKISYQ